MTFAVFGLGEGGRGGDFGFGMVSERSDLRGREADLDFFPFLLI